MTKKEFCLLNYMCDILNNFYEKNDLEYICANESIDSGNYNNDEQLDWLERYSDLWNKVEERFVERNYQ